MPGENIGDGVGADRVVSINDIGNIVDMETPFDNGNGGAVRVYELIAGVWTQRGSEINGETIGDKAGRSVSLNSTGDVVAIGATSNTGVNGGGSGHVRVYDWNTTA